MEQESASLNPLAAEWDRVVEHLQHRELDAMLRLMFFLGAHRAIAHVVRAKNHMAALALLRMELREFEKEAARPEQERAA
jgi:hypothetical protein